MMKLKVQAMALTSALIWGVGLFCITWWIIMFDGATGEVPFLGKIYRGYNISATGSFIGLAWGLVDGYIGGLVFAWIYNFTSERCFKQT